MIAEKSGRKRPVIDWAFLLVAALSITAATLVYSREGWAKVIKLSIFNGLLIGL